MRRTAYFGLMLLMAGCQSRLNFDRSMRVEAGKEYTLDIDPPRYDQKVSVTIETDAPVKAHVYLKKDAEAAEKDLNLKSKSDKVLGEWTGDKSGTIEVAVPAHQIAIVRIEATGKAANVKVKVVGK
jgi:hypothetical protein